MVTTLNTLSHMMAPSTEPKAKAGVFIIPMVVVQSLLVSPTNLTTIIQRECPLVGSNTPATSCDYISSMIIPIIARMGFLPLSVQLCHPLWVSLCPALTHLPCPIFIVINPLFPILSHLIRIVSLPSFVRVHTAPHYNEYIIYDSKCQAKSKKKEVIENV